MMSDIPEFSLVRTDKLEDHPVRSVHSKAPHLMMKRVALEQVRFGSSFSSNGSVQFVKQAIKGRGRRNLDHDRLFDQFAQGLPFGDSTSPMISLRSIEGVEKFRPVQSDSITEGLKVSLRDLNIEALPCSLCNPGRKRVCHGVAPSVILHQAHSCIRKSNATKKCRPFSPEGRKQDRGRHLRRERTDAERTLCHALRSRQLSGLKSRRQHPIGSYFVVVRCLELTPAIELDGGQHALQADADARRSHSVAQEGYRVLRFWNHEVPTNLEGVLHRVAESASPSPQPSP